MTRQPKRRTYGQHILERGLQEVAQLLLRDELNEAGELGMALNL